ncbi:peptide chain release factor N(5)-glutamine methyltransferase [Candidatus Saccharibacteria bacterium]|jgi:release factor glutamine methyltransferase|nr:peptide chain release factor N(5)-glutamine methyltransferase [Candidatus Saccharibacteria bacterium]
MNISEWLRSATRQLKEIGIESSRLDAELILSHTLHKPRTYLHAHLDDKIDQRHKDIADARLQLRLERVPIAYITGHKEFYGRRFKVTPATLIPRPESENIIHTLLAASSNEITPKTLIDIGTGSGALAITAKLERPHLAVTASDISDKALAIAKENAKIHNTNIYFRNMNLLNNHAGPIDYLIANLPYVDKDWVDTSPELKHEPSIALYAQNKGLDLINKLLPQAQRWLTDKGILLLEADPSQHESIIKEARKHDLKHVQTKGYCLALVKN